MGIGGKQRESNFSEQPKYVGLFEGRVIAINPSMEEFEKIMGWTPKEESKQFDYLGENQDGNAKLRIDVWIEEVRERTRDDKPVHEKFKLTFFLENKERENKDFTRKQYINAVGICSWSDDPNTLPDWFKERTYRVAYAGEEELYNFLRMWLSKLDFRSAETVLELDWKKLMRGNVKELRDQINGEFCNNIVALATVEVTEKETEIREYQRVYRSAFLSPYSLKFFRTINYNDSEVVERLKGKKTKELKNHEKFVLDVKHEEYGCKDFYILNDIELYDPKKNFAASSKVISDEKPDY